MIWDFQPMVHAYIAHGLVHQQCYSMEGPLTLMMQARQQVRAEADLLDCTQCWAGHSLCPQRMGGESAPGRACDEASHPG